MQFSSRVSGLVLAGLLACAAVQAQTATEVSATPLTTSDTYAINGAINKWMEALSARDAKAAEAHVADGATGVFQGAVADYDAEAFAHSLALTFKSQGEKGTWSNEIQEIVGSGDMAVVRSKRTLTRSADSGSTAATTMNLLEVYVRYSDGSWRMSRFLGFPA